MLNDAGVYSGEVRAPRKSALMLWSSEDKKQHEIQVVAKAKQAHASPYEKQQAPGLNTALTGKKAKSASAGQKARARSSPSMPGSKSKVHKGQPVWFNPPERLLCSADWRVN